MSLDVVLRAAVVPGGGEIPGVDDAKDARLSLKLGLAFLDGRKLAPLKNLQNFRFEAMQACLAWPGGPSMRLCFSDDRSLETFKSAVEKAALRPALSVGSRSIEVVSTPSTSSSQPAMMTTPQAVHSRPAVATPQAHLASQRRRPVRRVDNAGSAAKRQRTNDQRAPQDDDEELESAPAPPRVDETLSCADREERRRLAAAKAAARAAEAQSRGIGDTDAARRMQERAEREELFGRIRERCLAQKREVPWNIGSVPLEELRRYLKSLSPELQV